MSRRIPIPPNPKFPNKLYFKDYPQDIVHLAYLDSFIELYDRFIGKNNSVDGIKKLYFKFINDNRNLYIQANEEYDISHPDQARQHMEEVDNIVGMLKQFIESDHVFDFSDTLSLTLVPFDIETDSYHLTSQYYDAAAGSLAFDAHRMVNIGEVDRMIGTFTGDFDLRVIDADDIYRFIDWQDGENVRVELVNMNTDATITMHSADSIGTRIANGRLLENTEINYIILSMNMSQFFYGG